MDKGKGSVNDDQSNRDKEDEQTNMDIGKEEKEREGYENPQGQSDLGEE